MDNVTFFDNNGFDWVLIDRGNNEFTSMSKSIWDEQQAALSTPIAAKE